jgi:Domain of unknown function (DUF4389)
MSTHYATSGGVSPAAADEQELAPVLVTFAAPAPQSRLTVLVRIILVIPHLIVLGVLGIAAYVVAIVGWFGALFTGRLPGFAADFLAGYLRWQTRVSAYAFLLTGDYPPFSLADADYPARVAVQPGRLNRLAVLFRIFLLIPCGIVQAILSYGALTIFQLVSWVITLITGRLPDPLYQAMAAVLRYQARTLGFAWMLTSAYPAALFGDERGYGVRPGRDLGDDPDMSWRLSAAARKLIVGFLVLGVLIVAGAGTGVGISVGSTAAKTTTDVNTLNATNQLVSVITPVTNVVNNYAANVKACKGQLACVEGVDRKVATVFSTFGKQLAAIKMPTAKTRALNATLIASVAHTGGLYGKLATAPSATKYISEASAADLQTALDQTNQAYANLGDALNL